MNRLVLPAALAAIGAGAGFGNPLFSLPALTSLRYRDLELEWLLLPTLAAVMIAVAFVGAQRIPGRGYPLAAAGALAGAFAVILGDRQVGGMSGTVVWVLAIAGAGGLVLGGLAVAAATGSGSQRLAIGAGLAVGIVLSNRIAELLRAEMWPGFLIHLAVFVAAVVAAALAWGEERGPAPATGTLTTIVLAGVIAMAGLVARSALVLELGPAGLAHYSALAAGVVAALVLTWEAFRLGRADLARWPVLGFALAAPVTTLATGFAYGTQTVGALGIAAGTCAVVAGGVLARYADWLVPWEAVGVFVATVGLVLGSVSTRMGVVAYLLVLCGSGFALSAGLVRTAALPSAGTGVGIGLAALLLSAQAMSPVTLELFGTGGFGRAELVAPAASAVAALAIIGLFAFRSSRTPTPGPLPYDLLTQGA